MPELEMELTGSDEVVEETPAEETPSPENPEEKVSAEEVVDEDGKTTPEPEVIEEELFDLPDGRKVNAAGLKTEYENLLPEFTKKSQRLAEYEKLGNIKNKPDDEKEWENPDYVPKDYAEIVKIATGEAVRKMEEGIEKEQVRKKEMHDQVESELAEIRKIDPKLNENALFIHANKYGMQSLKFVHQNMMDMKKAVLNTEKTTIKNLKTRESDPVSTVPSPSTVETDEGYSPTEMSQYQSANDYLSHIKGKK